MKYILIAMFLVSCGVDESKLEVTSITVEHHDHWGERVNISATSNVPRTYSKVPDVGFVVSDKPVDSCEQNAEVEWEATGIWFDAEPGKTYHIRACVLYQDGGFSKGITRQFTLD